MIESYDLYGGKPPYQSQSDTSEAAAEAMLGNIETLRFKVFDFIKSQEKIGATDQEIQEALNLEMSTEIPRRRELVLKGFVLDSGYRRRTKSNRFATVWIASGSMDASELGPHRSTKIILQEAQAEIERLKKELKDEISASKKAVRFYKNENKKLCEQVAQLQLRLRNGQAS